MPRVNRDLQRRMAARRERERRRPTPGERRYRFASAEPEAEALEEAGADDSTQVLESGLTAAPAQPQTPTRASARPAARTFADYRTEYAYVSSDLKRVALVIGSLLLILIVLYLLLPH